MNNSYQSYDRSSLESQRIVYRGTEEDWESENEPLMEEIVSDHKHAVSFFDALALPVSFLSA